MFSDEFMSGNYKRSREREEQEYYDHRSSQRSTRWMSQRTYTSDPCSMDSPVGIYQEKMRLGYHIEENPAAKMPEYISTPTPSKCPPLPSLPIGITQDKFSCHQDSESSSASSRALL